MSQQPDKVEPGDRVRIAERPEVFTVIDTDGTLVTLRSVHGVECRCGWRVIRAEHPDTGRQTP